MANTKKRLLAATLGLVALAGGPHAVGYVQTELESGRRLDALARVLPPKTTVIKSKLAVEHSTDGACHGLVAKVLATELTGPDVARVFRGSSTSEDQAEVNLAYYSGGRYRVESADSGGQTANAGPLPPPIRALFDQHAFLPDGVRR